ncbi:MAG: glycosyltransferase family 39 protein [Hydrogenothermaceae bacterium]|nr:glycosyltransferase family 39 protein [Hydrogenothermaceae bacterium]
MESSLNDRYKIYLLVFLTVFVYFWNFWYNAIWIPNESFYAEAVREMFESKNFVDIYYNYEPRFEKPPMTYWAVALSCLIFGINEFAIRLPIVLMAIATGWITYKIALLLYDKKTAIYSFFAFTLGFQFVINSRYASPEVPLTFFLTLTIYLFLKGYKESKILYIYLSYTFLGITVLTKGYPYYFVAGGIVGLYFLIESKFNLREFFKKLLSIKVYIGLPISLVIGLSWIVYMDVKFGQQFWEVYNKETVKRAFGESFKFMDIFFYPTVILWGFLPYSLTFYYGFLHSFKKFLNRHSFIFSYFITMLVIFTIAKGKIPTYFIQAHVPMAILVGYYLSNHNPEGFKKYIYLSSLVIPTAIIITLNFLLIYYFKLDYLLYLLALFPILYILRFKDIKLAPFVSMLITFMIFVISLLPMVEKFRPYKQIGQIINDNIPDRYIPLIVENRFFHNLPFYTKRKVLRDYSQSQILEYSNKNRFMVALVEENTVDKIPNKTVLWEGYLYTSSESRFAVFLQHIKKFQKGESDRFVKMYLIYKQ